MSGVKDLTTSAKRTRKPVTYYGNVVTTNYNKPRKNTSLLEPQSTSRPAAIQNQSLPVNIMEPPQSTSTNPVDFNPAPRARSNSGGAQSLARSMRSVHSTSKMKKALVDLEALQKLNEQKKAKRKYEKYVEEVKIKFNEVNVREKEVETKIKESYMSTEQREALIAEQEELKKKRGDLAKDLEYLEEQLIFTEEAIARIPLETEVKKSEIEVQEDEELDRRSHQEHLRAVDEWATASANRISQPGSDNGTDSEVEELTEQLTRLRTGSNETAAKKPEKKKEPAAAPTPTNPFDQVAQAITAAIDAKIAGVNLKNPATGSTDRFLARQVQGKDLPHFNGRPEEWPAFYAAYQNSTMNCHYSDADNLPRLQKCLSGEAKKTVQCLLIKPDGVPKAMKILEMRFGRPTVIIKTLVEQARKMPVVKPDQPNMYINYGIAVNNLVEMVTALEKPEHLSNPTLVEELVSKLPLSNQIEWMRSGITDSPTLMDFSKWLLNLTEAVCKLCPPNITESSQATAQAVRYRGRNNQDKKSNHKERAMVATEKTSENKNGNRNQDKGFQKSQCITCSSTEHRSHECKVFKEKRTDERWEIVKRSKVCFGCLGKNHAQKDCRIRKMCGINGCKKDHNRLLHSEPKTPAVSNKPPEQVKKVQEDESNSDAEQCKMVQGGQRINYLVIPVMAKNGVGEFVPVYLALDSYSSLTAISAETANYLGLKGTKKPLTVSGFQATNTVKESYQLDLEIKSKSGDFEWKLENVRTVPELELAEQSLPIELIKRYKHLRDLPLEPYNEIVPTILVGIDNYPLHLHHEIREGKPGQPAAAKTALGWTVIGKVPSSYRSVHHCYKMNEFVEDPLHRLVEQFFSTEAAGTEPQLGKPRTREDLRAQKIMDDTIKRVEDGWETGLLWRDDEVRFPKSKEYALKRLMSMERKMDKDPAFANQYCEHVETFMKKGFARILTPEEAAQEDEQTFYLPHFMAYNEKKSNKYRFVFDAAAQVRGESLNSHLLQGPDKLASLVGILLKFRQRKVAITADIKDFFLRVKVRKEDVNAQRFLWRGMDRDKPPSVCRMESLIFGAACSPACAQEAKEKNAREFKEEYPEAYDAITYKHYVDDYLDSVDTEEEAIKLQKEVTEIQSRGSFQLCNWMSNSQAVLDAIPEELHAKSLKAFDGKEDLIERVLGLFWRPETDDFTFQLKYLKAKEDIMKGEKTPSKREVLSLVMSVFDPLGLIAILIVKAKMILQAAWRSKITWDDTIPATTFDRWKQWLEELAEIETFSIPRCYSPNFSTAEDVQLHVFGDGSEEAFGAVAYFRIVTGTKIETSLVMAKSNVAPLKPLSIPRLELQASVKGVRMSRFITDSIDRPINRVVFWTDSFTVLRWIRADGRRFKQFVATRVGKIQTLSEVSQWKWVPTEENVADELTRFAKPCDWSPASRWLNGPAFLKQEEEFWPKEPEHQLSEKEDEPELKKEQIFAVKEIKPIIDPARFSTWEKLLRTIAYCCRFGKSSKENRKCAEYLTAAELKNAETILIKLMQQEMFGPEIENIKKNEPLHKSNKLFKLSPALENNILVVKGRLDNAAGLNPRTRRPIIIDPKNPMAKLLLDYYHRIFGHHGQEKIANEIRQRFNVIGLRTAVRSAQNRCQSCKNKRAMPQPPEMGQLPEFRTLLQSRPFIVTGLDYFGPIEVIVKRSREKRYVALFTCLSTRAVHLEIAGSLSTDSCIMAIRRFVARRGCPQSIYSDNGTNFVGANHELRKALKEMDQTKLNGFCSSQSIQWNFNPPSAPHMGGSWERLVRSVKAALGDTLQKKNLQEEVLNTLLIEAEHSVNSHPLTHVPHDPNDPEALTPNHFLIGKSSSLQPCGDFRENDLYGRQHWKVSQTLAEHFWKRWVKEYLPTLLRREKWCQTTKSIAVGDIVVEVNNNLHRNMWPLGRVVKLFPGKDGIVRVVDIVLANRHVYRRPVAKLCILDVQKPCHDEIADRDNDEIADRDLDAQNQDLADRGQDLADRAQDIAERGQESSNQVPEKNQVNALDC